MPHRLLNMQREVIVAAAAPAPVDVYVVAAGALAPRLLSRAARLLDDGDRRRLSRLVGASAGLELLAGRALVRAVLSARLGTPPDGWRLATTAAGRPHVAGGAGRGRFDFSLSHAGGLVCCALVDGAGRVGVDLERCDRALDPEALAAVALAPDERAGLAACAPAARRVRLLRLLTLKEAYLKALGCGLTVRPSSVVFDLDPDGGGARLRGPESARWRFATRARGGFVLAVAAETRASRVANDETDVGAGLALRLHAGGPLCRVADQSLPDVRSAA